LPGDGRRLDGGVIGARLVAWQDAAVRIVTAFQPQVGGSQSGGLHPTTGASAVTLAVLIIWFRAVLCSPLI
jgi:hypothetical protein